MANTAQVILDHLRQRGPGWVMAREVACELGHPWQGVARVMASMPELERQEMVWIGPKFRPRVCYIYRFVSPPTAMYPAWMTGALMRR